MKRKLLFAIVALLCSVGLNAQKDVTSQYITNATLSDGTNGWTKTHTKTTQTNDPADAFSNSVRGNNTVGYASEAYAGYGSLIQTAYSMKQTITLPAGNYRLVCYAFFRQGVKYNTNSSKSLAKLKAGAAEVALKTLGSITAKGYANSQAEGANCFDSKMYRNVVEFTSDGSPIEIGIEGTFDEAKSWCIVGQFELFDMDDLASISSPTDVTYAITNPGFEYRDATGWTSTGNGGGYADNNNFNSKAGVGFAESWGSGSVGKRGNGSFTQTLGDMPAGLYELSVYAHNVEQYSGDAAGTGMYLKANDNQTAIGAAGQYKVRTTLVSDGDLTIGINLENCTGNWIAFDRFELKFYGDPLEAYKVLLADAVSNAGTLKNSAVLSDAQKAAWQAIIDANDNDDNAFTEESEFSTAIENIENANTLFQSLVAPYASFNALKTAANIIAGVEYIEKSSGSHTTYTDAVSAQTSAADNATTVSAVNTAYSTLKSAIKTYISSAEPKNEGEYFDITCLIENPSFEANNATGWSGDTPGFESYANAEFFNKNFDFYQDLSGLPQGSYQLSVQAFCRPGDNGNTTAGAYYDYYHGTNNITAELYLNNGTTTQASKVGNIYAYKDNTTGAKVVGNDFHCEISPDNYWVPNNMKGAGLYFEDGAYTTEVAALVDASGTLKIGFRENSKKTNQWVIFDNFKLYYYGSSKMRYYQQYLPQLEAEIRADFLENGAYDVLKTGQTERAALASANSANADELDTEKDLQNAIDAITTARDNFVAAKNAYENLSDALTTAAGYITNSGSGVFQVTSAAASTLSSQKTTSQGVYDTGTASKSSVDAELATLNAAIATAAATLNAPDAEKRYVLTIVEAGKDWNGYAVTFREGDTNADQGNFGIKYQTTTNADYNQAIRFTAITGNTYKLSVTRADGTEMYLTTSKKGYNKDDGGFGDERIRMTSDASKALEVEIRPTSTANQFQLYNSTAPGIIANNNNNDMYTANSCNFTIAEASQASVTVKANAGKYGTVIFPFKPDVSTGFDGITFYSIDGINDVTNRVRLNVVANPVANTPYLIKNASEDNLNKPITGWGAAYKDSYDSGDTDIKLTGVYTAATIAASVAATADTNGAYRYVLQTQDATQAFYKVDADFTATAYKCYLTVKQDKTVTGVKAFFLDFGDADAVNDIEAAQNENTIYNLAGQRVNKAQKGLYIVNGKKVMVK